MDQPVDFRVSFLGLPPEVRLTIYRLVFQDSRIELSLDVLGWGNVVPNCQTIVRHFRPQRSLLCTCHTIYAEALPIFQYLKDISKPVIWRNRLLLSQYHLCVRQGLLGDFRVGRLDNLKHVQLPVLLFDWKISKSLPSLRTVELGYLTEKWTDSVRYISFRPTVLATIQTTQALVARVKEEHLAQVRYSRYMAGHLQQLQNPDRGFSVILTALVDIRWTGEGMIPCTRYEKSRVSLTLMSQ